MTPPPRSALAPRESEVYDFIVRYKQENDGNSPAYTVIGRALYITRQTVYDHVNSLIGKGFIQKRDGKLIVVR